MRLLKQPEYLDKASFTRLGINGRIAFFKYLHPGGVGIWQVDTLVPSSHKRILLIPYTKTYYAHSTMGRDECGRTLIYLLLFTADSQDHLFVRLHEIRILDQRQEPIHNVFEIGHPADMSNPLFSAPIDNLTMGVGQRENGVRAPRTLFFYDGSIIQGDIPYWRILLDRESWTFAIDKDTVHAVDPGRVGGNIPDDEPRMVSRFPVVIDGAKRRFLRFGLDHRLFVFTEERADGKPSSRGSWIPYSESVNNAQSLDEIHGSRQLRETYSSIGHRATAIESRYTFNVHEDVCILRHRYDDRHHRYSRLILDDVNLEYYFVPCGVAEFGSELSVGRMSYISVTDRIVVIAGSQELAVIDLQPQRLTELAFWAIQKQISSRCTKTGALYNGWSAQKISEMIGYVDAQQLI